MSHPFKNLLLLLVFAMLAACSTVSVEDYADNKPRLDVRQFFNGSLDAHGIVKNRSGKVIRYFSAKIEASWKDGVGTLDEHFIFDDGEEQIRIWKLKPDESGVYHGTADDVIGVAQLKAAGNSLFLEYILRVPYGDGTIDVNIDDRMYLLNDRVLLNESILTKWGFEVGQLTLVIEKSN
ncbi:MAG: DUF3833 domain-containing protein [Pseudomonadota bacterium]